jgi:hypothetical protein
MRTAKYGFPLGLTTCFCLSAVLGAVPDVHADATREEGSARIRSKISSRLLAQAEGGSAPSSVFIVLREQADLSGATN